MAKTKAQTRTLLREMVTMFDNIRDHLTTELQANYETVKAEIEKGSPGDYAMHMQEALEDLADAANEYWVAARMFMRMIHMPLGAWAGSEDPTGSQAVNISKFNQKLIDNGESIVDLGLTKNAFSAAGGNTGNAVVVEITDDPNGDDMEGAHNESLTLECISIGSNGRPQWALYGNERKRFLFDEDMGTGNNKGGYMFDWGAVPSDFSKLIKMLRTNSSASLVEWDGGDQRNMVVNGNMEADIGSSGDDEKIPGATIISGESNIDVETSNPITGEQSLKISGNAEIEFPLIGGGRSGLPLAMSCWIQRVSTFSGNFDFIFRSGPSGSPTDHKTVSETIGGLTAGTNTNESDGVIIPNDVGEQPRLVLKVSSSGGSGSLLVDMLVGALASLFDSNRALAIMSGPTRSRRGDKFTASNVIASSPAPFQRMFVELFGRSLTHSASGSYWTP